MLSTHHSTVSRPAQDMVGRQTIQVHLPPIWTVQCTKDVHQAYCSVPLRERNSSDYIYRRYSSPGKKATFALLMTLEFMCFLVYCEKSVPDNREFLGFQVKPNSMSIAMLQGKVQKIYEQAELLLLSPTPSAREIARLVGSSIPAVAPAPLYYHATKRH